MSQVIKTENLSAEIVVDLIASNLKSSINDPLNNRSSSDADFVVTSMPDKGVQYPHLVVAEENDSAVPVDNIRKMKVHDSYDAVVEVYARSDTEKFKLRDKVKSEIERLKDEFQDKGFADVQYSSGGTTPDAESEVKSVAVTVSGLVHTHPNPSN